MKLPVKIKANSADQVDYVLHQLESSELIGMQLLSYVVDDHLPVPTVLDTLAQLDGYKTSVIDISREEIVFHNASRLLCITDNGDVNVLEAGSSQGSYRISLFKNLLEIYFTEEVSFDRLINELKVVALLKIDKLPPSATTSIKAIDSTAQSHYAVQHFIRHFRTIASIIGISVMLALLGVITPLGFQTFTDKILPYQAQNSLMAVAILLVVAAFV